ncbi:MAG: hypothetical protein RLY50_1142, partial [Actinomycetota bacterium]
MLCKFEAMVDPTKHRVSTDAHVFHTDLGVVGRHVEGPPEELDGEARR